MSSHIIPALVPCSAGCLPCDKSVSYGMGQGILPCGNSREASQRIAYRIVHNWQIYFTDPNQLAFSSSNITFNSLAINAQTRRISNNRARTHLGIVIYLTILYPPCPLPRRWLQETQYTSNC